VKRFDKPTVNIILLTGIIAPVLTGLYFVRAMNIEPYGERFVHTDLSRKGGNLQDWKASFSSELSCPLPQGWQAGWNGGKLWITHYNLDGSVADSLAFDSLERLCYWVEAHPDCCDVDIDQLKLPAPKDAVPVSRAGLIK